MMNGEEPLPPLETILLNLKAIANKVRTNASFCENMKDRLKKYGYDWFDDSSANDKQVMKVLAVAVNEAIQEKVNLQHGNTTEVKNLLHRLLNIDKDKSVDQYFFNSSWISKLKDASSPLDMAQHLGKNVPQWLVKNMIQNQFEIEWNTPSGEPHDYTFYELCDMKNMTKLFKYNPRQAHVKATLYKECRRTREFCEQSITKEELCPKVYIKTTSGWKSWQEEAEINIHGPGFSWINPSILRFIEKNADEQNIDSHKSFQDLFAKPTLYWAVLDDTDFNPGGILKLKPIGRTQVYVGKANKGIRGRWIQDSNNHCEMMKKCLDNVRAMTTYDPLRLKEIQLVDARLALAKLRNERTALFVVKTFGDEVEKAEIAQKRAEESLNEAKGVFLGSLCKAQDLLSNTTGSMISSLKKNVRKLKLEWNELIDKIANINGLQVAKEPEDLLFEIAERASKGAELFVGQAKEWSNQMKSLFEALEDVIGAAKIVKKLKKELDKATAFANELESSETNRSKVEQKLKDAEKLHLKGKKVNPRYNIIPFNDYKMTWKPTNQRYGMNCY